MKFEYYKHQKRYLKRIENKKRDLCAAPTGSGKTLLQLAIAKQQIEQYKRKTLIIIPPNIITSWLKQHSKFFPDLKIFRYSGYRASYYTDLCEKWGVDKKGPMSARQRRLMGVCDAVIMSPQIAVSYPGSWKKWSLIVDESDMFGDPKSNRSKWVLKNFKGAEFIYLFSATPADNPFKIWVQSQLIAPDLFPKYYQFQAFYGEVNKAAMRKIQKRTGRNVGTIWMPKDNKEARERDWIDIKEKLKDHIYWIDKKEVLPDLKPIVEYLIEIEPPKGLPKEYRWNLKNMKKKSEDSQFLDEVIRYQQLASGFLYPAKDEDGEPIGETEIFSHSKLRELDAILKKHPNEKMIIWTNFIKEDDDIINEIGRVNCAIATRHKASKGVDNEIKFWENKARILIARHSSIGRGVDGLQHHARIHVIYSPQYRGSTDEQMIARLARGGQKDQVLVYRFSTLKTIEPHVIRAMELKVEFNNYIIGAIE